MPDQPHPRGRVVELQLRSKLLEGNLQNDPSIRGCPVYLPAAAEEGGARRFPLLVDLVGFTGSGYSHTNWRAFGESLPQRLDRLISTGAMAPAVVAMPDLFTSLGGNQYIDSSALGPYGRVICEELLPLLEAELPVLGGRAHRAVFGKSSGGFGAISHAMSYPEVWAAAACHSGDMDFGFCYLPTLPPTLDAIARAGGTIPKFIEAFRANKKPGDKDIHALMTLCMAATYDPDPSAPYGIRLPCDLRTGEMDAERWQRWLVHDPVTRARDPSGPAIAALKELALVFIDCGARDQYHLVYGARQLHAKLEAAGVAHVYEEFDDDHSGIDYRMDVSLPRLVEAIS